MKHIYLLLLAVLFATACSSKKTQEELSKEWPNGKVESFVKDIPEFEKQTARADTLEALRSLLVIRDGQLIFEKYYNGHHEHLNFHVRSVTKSFMSALTGIALEKGHLDSVGQPVGQYFDELVTPKDKARLDSITVKDLLTMSSGYDWDESSGNGYVSWYDSDDRINYLTERALVAEPGAEFEYNSAAVHLLSVVLEKAIDRPLIEFAKEHLFDPLGISMEDVDYQQDERDFVNGGAGFELRARDMAKLGQLILNKGEYRGQRVLPADWVDQTIYNHMPFDAPQNGGRLYTRGYGYLWWLFKVLGEDGALAWGWGGQFIMVIPSTNTMIITHNKWNVGDQQNRLQVNSTFRIMLGILETME